MSEKEETHKKADGSAMDAQRAAIAERNAKVKKAGRENRAKRELVEARKRHELEARLSEALRLKG